VIDREGLLAFIRAALDFAGIDPQEFADKALWAAVESQKTTAIPALAVVWSVSLLVVIAWIVIARWVIRQLSAKLARNDR
jgi:hypothetical protein